MLNSFLGAACAGAPIAKEAAKNAVATTPAKERANGVMVQSSLSVRFNADRGLARHRRQSWRSRSPGLLSRRAPELAPLKRQLSDLTLRSDCGTGTLATQLCQWLSNVRAKRIP